MFADVSENFRRKYIEISELDPAQSGLAWQVCFKKAAVKLELLANNDM